MTKILLVEDNDINRDLLSEQLRQQGYEVLLAVDGETAVSIAQSNLPNLILMDTTLPIMDGWEASKRLKSDSHTSSIPIVALIPIIALNAEEREKSIAAGCDDYYTKPIEPLRLIKKIETMLNLQPIAIGDPNGKIPSDTPIIPPSLNPVQINSLSTSLPESRDINPANILVVDDDQTFLQILARRLEGSGYNTILASDGTEALEILSQRSIDLVLLDIMMPKLSGLDTLKTIRAKHSMAQLPVIMVTAKDGTEDTIEAFELGANDYVTKPIDLPIIMARVKSHLRSKQRSIEVEKPTSLPKSEDTPSLPVILTIPDSDTGTKLLLDRYQIERKLSQHSLEKTYLARDLHESGHPFCVVEQIQIETISSELITPATYQWAKEVKAFQNLNYSNTIKIYTAFKNKRFFYIVREYIEGTPLLDKIQAETSLSLLDVLSLILEMLEILTTLHQEQLIHQHLHPTSFLSRPHQHLILVNLGINERLAATLKQNKGIKANIYHPFPQQGQNLTTRSDIYAVAAITLQALTGLSPDKLPRDAMTGEIKWRHLRTVPEMFANILDKMLSKHPIKCYHSVETILKDLHQLPIVCTLFG
jgi:DNA-binding response OmpR family regulator